MFKKLASFFSAADHQVRPVQRLSVRCNRCGEIISARVDVANELSRTDDEGYIVRKTLMGGGENRCFQRVEITLHFNAKRAITHREITGGTFVD